jgi:serine/threonine-protein kinase
VSVERKYDDEVAEGFVISQRPDDGVGYAGDDVELVVSLGPHLVEVPNVNRFGIDDAEDALADQGFRSSRREFEPYLGLGFVVGQSPAAGELAPFGSTVVLTVV